MMLSETDYYKLYFFESVSIVIMHIRSFYILRHDEDFHMKE